MPQSRLEVAIIQDTPRLKFDLARKLCRNIWYINS